MDEKSLTRQTNPHQSHSSDWRQREARSQPGKYYYVNVKTGETVWKEPAGFKPEGYQEKKDLLKSRLGKLQLIEEACMKELKELQEQLCSIESLLSTTPEDDSLLALRIDLKKLIKLKESDVVIVKKKILLAKMDFSKLATTSSSFSSSLHRSLPQANVSTNARIKSVSGVTTTATAVKSDTPVVIKSNESIATRTSFNSLRQGEEVRPEMQCRAPFAAEYGCLDYHDAVVYAVDEEKGTCIVLFVTPMYKNMIICQDFLLGKCKKDGASCIYSHGCEVKIEQLKEGVDFSEIELEKNGPCLFKKESLWKYGTFIRLKPGSDGIAVVKPRFGGFAVDVAIESVRAVPSQQLSSLDGDGQDEDNDEHDNDNDGGRTLFRSRTYDNDVVEQQAKEGQMSTHTEGAKSKLARWEQYGSGFGSKILSQLGYKEGDGLGAKKQGRVDPVPIVILPTGKSLDYIMERNAKKILSEFKQVEVIKMEKQDVFAFLNATLASKNTLVASSAKRPHSSSSSSASSSSFQQAKKEKKATLNSDIVFVNDEIATAQKLIFKLRKDAKRQSGVLKQNTEIKISNLESQLETLNQRKCRLEGQSNRQRARKKLVEF
eukprot:m.56298 g.56298  ORF g.56298 m.56298 type:complete len:602 (-) comp7793_c0_seq1:498-2303(-)